MKNLEDEIDETKQCMLCYFMVYTKLKGYLSAFEALSAKLAVFPLTCFEN